MSSYASLLPEQTEVAAPARMSTTKKIAYGALAAVGVVGAIVGVVSLTSSTGPIDASQAKLGLVSHDEYETVFARFMAEHGKVYATLDEYMTRFQTFKQNLDYIRKHNSNDYEYTLGINKFSDMSREEFKAKYLGTRPPVADKNVVVLDASTAPASIDWRTKGAVNEIKDQGQCGSCWAFSTVGSVEGRTAVKTGELPNLSEQQLVDCAGKEGNNGCSGGLMDYGFQYIIDNKGITSESKYPYTAADGHCKKKLSADATITSFADVTANSEAQLMAAVAQGPVSVAIEADQSSFQMYSSGVFTGPCGTNLDHGVVVVGYGTDAGKDYWIVRNSWGTSWGDEGYIRIQRNTGGAGLCSIAMSASYPVV